MSHPVQVKILGRERKNLKELALSSILSFQAKKITTYRTTQARVVLRARIVLVAGEGKHDLFPVRYP